MGTSLTLEPLNDLKRLGDNLYFFYFVTRWEHITSCPSITLPFCTLQCSAIFICSTKGNILQDLLSFTVLYNMQCNIQLFCTMQFNKESVNLVRRETPLAMSLELFQEVSSTATIVTDIYAVKKKYPKCIISIMHELNCFEKMTCLLNTYYYSCGITALFISCHLGHCCNI